MYLKTLRANYERSTSDTVTFSWACTARLEATDEASVPWVLEVNWHAHGQKKMVVPGGRELLPGMVVGDNEMVIPAPHIKSGAVRVGPGQEPTGLKMGDNWKPVFEEEFQKATILVNDNDQYLFFARLVPLPSYHESNTRADTVNEDID